jgi:GT2 family glycosyltransferase
VDGLLNSLDAVTLPTPVVLVNDASTPDVLKRLELFTGWRPSTAKAVCLTNHRQQLFTRTVNRGIRHAVHQWGAEAVAVVNTDCALRVGWLQELQKALKDLKVGMAGYWDNNFPDVDLKKHPFTEVRLPDYVTGHCFILRVEMLREIGVLCETDTDGRQDRTLAPFRGQAHIGSERILSWRANSLGWRTLYCNSPLVEHGNGKSWGRDLAWLSQFMLEPLWEPCDTLEEPRWY